MERGLVRRWEWMLGVIALLFAFWLWSGPPVAAQTITETYKLYLPLVSKAPDPCEAIDGGTYTTLDVVADPTGLRPPNDPETDPGFNLGLLGYELTDETKGLIYYDGGGDAVQPPTFQYLFGDHRIPTFPNVYKLHNSDGTVVTSYPVTMLGMETELAEIIYTPESGYDIGGGYDAMVAYASTERITLIYNRYDNLHGYAVYIENICVEPSLLALFRQMEADDNAPPQALPVVRGGQPLGRARGEEIRIVIRDQGTAMDPRACNSWWDNACP